LTANVLAHAFSAACKRYSTRDRVENLWIRIYCIWTVGLDVFSLRFVWRGHLPPGAGREHLFSMLPFLQFRCLRGTASTKRRRFARRCSTLQDGRWIGADGRAGCRDMLCRATARLFHHAYPYRLAPFCTLRTDVCRALLPGLSALCLRHAQASRLPTIGVFLHFYTFAHALSARNHCVGCWWLGGSRRPSPDERPRVDGRWLTCYFCSAVSAVALNTFGVYSMNRDLGAVGAGLAAA
jgi:hypothetical protein